MKMGFALRQWRAVARRHHLLAGSSDDGGQWPMPFAWLFWAALSALIWVGLFGAAGWP